jgi:hypothetical protein
MLSSFANLCFWWGLRVQEIAAQMFSPCPGLNPYHRSFWVSVINMLESGSSSQVLCFHIGIISEQYLFFFLAQPILCKCLFHHALKLNMSCRFQAPYAVLNICLIALYHTKENRTVIIVADYLLSGFWLQVKIATHLFFVTSKFSEL